MNYQEALGYLAQPRQKNSKKIGSNLELRVEPGLDHGLPTAILKYYGRDILVWNRDGSIKLGLSGYEFSPITIDKVNKYLPAGWRYSQLNLRHHGRGSNSRTGIVAVRDTHLWKDIISMPYGGDDAIYTVEGRADKEHPVSNYQTKDKDALTFFTRVGDYVDEWVEAFLHGEISQKPVYVQPDASVSRVRGDFAGTWSFVLERVISADLLMHFGAGGNLVNWEPSLRKAVHLFWQENYPYMVKAKTQKMQAAQLAHQMRSGVTPEQRPPPATLRARLKRELEDFILSDNGFAITYK